VDDETVDQAKSVFRRRVRELREDRGWSYAEAAVGSGLTRGNWRKIETGDVDDPSLTSLLRMQRRLGLASIEELFGPLPSPPRPVTGRLLDADLA
jgi:transcriptional regulator with XRE-family HTH domain